MGQRADLPKWSLSRRGWPWKKVISLLVLVIITCIGLLSFRTVKRVVIEHQQQTPHFQQLPAPEPEPELDEDAPWAFDYKRDANNRGLTAAQCEAAFPEGYQEIDRARDWHHQHNPDGLIQKADIDQYDGRAQVRAMIYDGQLRLLGDRMGLESKHIPDRPIATFNAIYRALVALPNPRIIPNIEFTIDTQDDALNGGPKKTMWSYCRERDSNGTWVMPDFGFWSFPAHTIGSYNEFLDRVDRTEEDKGFFDKKNSLIWRGAEGNGGPIRREFMDAAKGKKWAKDVRWLDWSRKETVLEMHEHCRWRFAMHTEGVTWSGRLRYLQNCNNVVVAHKLNYFAHYYPLMISDGPDQNWVEVQRDFSDLDKKMTELVDDPRKAARIAENGRRVFKERYLTPAAEACYWRRMFRTWKTLQAWQPELWVKGEKQGIAWEEYLPTGKKWGEDVHP